jgi:hypothetical protein
MTCLNTLAILAPAKFENAGPRFDHDDFLEAGVCFILIPFVFSCRRLNAVVTFYTANGHQFIMRNFAAHS